jgi:NADPH-dependent 2,4-dienoyl-CoA reductase/sulfur reductase-like enzyme/pSer/pThr/pTyr-binding forkhead associated (FHA) protein
MAEQSGPTYLVIGNGVAGITCAEILRAEDATASIAVIADDPFPVYYRPALKDYLAGRVHEDKLWARSRSFYQDHNILFHVDRATGIDPAKHNVRLQSGRKLNYQKLLLANGARSASLKCPGLNLKGVTTLRTIADYQLVLERLNTVKRVVVCGSGTLALESIETLRHQGYQVTHLLRRNVLWSEVLDTTASDLVLQEEYRDGIDVRLNEEIAEIIGKRGEVEAVVTTKGERIPCEMVLIAIGIEPNIDFIRSSGIACGRGVKVDSKMRTNAPDIYAAGDVIEVTDAASGRTRVIGQWYPAIQQARAAAYSMLELLDTNRPFQATTFYNATSLYGLDFASVGMTNSWGFQEIIAEPQPRTYRKVLLKQGIPVGMLSLGSRKHALAFKRAIDHGVNLNSISARLFASDFNLDEWLDKQDIPGAILGVTRQGDAAVRAAVYGEKSVAPIAVSVSANAAKDSTTGESTSAPSQKSEPVRIEAYLVPQSDIAKEYQLSEVRLSQTRVMSIGRQPGVHLLIDQGTVSRRHAEISYANGQYVLHDPGSTNGTFVNDARLPAQSTYILKQGDQLRFGTVVKLTFMQRNASKDKTRKPSVGSMTMAGVTMLHEMDKGEPVLSLPMLNSDGSLLLPGASTPIPAGVVATFNEAPALVVLAGGAARGERRPPRVFSLKKGKQTSIGRDKENDIEIADIVVSRRHAEISPGPGGFYVRDLESSNGVIVNQAKIDNPYLLSHGDRIAIGSSMIYYIDLRMAPIGDEVPNNGRSRPQEMLVRPTAHVPAASSRGSERTERGGQGAERAPVEVTERQAPSSEPPLKICRKCGVANTRIARFCAGCSAPL